MRNHLIFIIFALLCVTAPLTARAWPTSAYAPQSALASGQWAKVAVPSSGLYRITDAQLRQWGFSEPDKVHVYGYGAARIPTALDLDGYADDLPLAPQERVAGGIVFYGQGPESLASSDKGNLYLDRNIYATRGCYFISDVPVDARALPVQGLPSASNPVQEYRAVLHYELDRVSPGEAGWLLVGESFKAQPTRKFAFKAPVQAGSGTLECGLVTNSPASAVVEFTVNGEKLAKGKDDTLPATRPSSYTHGSYTLTAHAFAFESQSISVEVSIPAAAGMRDCWLDYLALNIMAPIRLEADGHLCFSASGPVKLANASAETRIWDVTSPADASAINAAIEGSDAVWTNDYHGRRIYAAWNPSAKLPSPDFVERTPNQNIHGAEPADMVIFTLPAWRDQAERIANLHREAANPLTVAVMNVNEVYNEFASGTPDVGALRRCLKMMHDRGAEAGKPLRYALLMGRATYDNRHLTSQFDQKKSPGTIPCWLGGARSMQLSDNSAYGTDDVLAMLGDGSGTNLGLDNLSIAVGRMPVQTADEARSAVDKLLQYASKSKPGTWRSNLLFLADDGNNGDHVNQAEKMINEALAAPLAPSFVTKVYVDAYDIVSRVCQGGRDLMYRMLDEGVAWWIYCGHANNHSWTGEGMLTYNDINNLYLTHVPVLMAATCDFLRWDSNTLSGGEIFFHNRNGGTIATISATRPVYITENGFFTSAMGRAINRRDEAGRMPRLGDIYRNAKNNILNADGVRQSSTNRLRYVLMGDPAMEIATPSNLVRLDAIDGAPVGPDEQITLKALQQAKVAGAVTDPSGNVMAGFNGTVEINIYDAEHTMTTKGVRPDNVQINFEQHGDKLFAGSAPVKDGLFTMNVAMPGEIADNFRPATMTLAAYSATDHAAGVNRDFYVYGIDDTAAPDSVSPSIQSFVLNHSSFQPGGFVNTSPMAIASVADNVAINLSTSGIGHQMTLTLDGKRTFTDVAAHFSPSPDGTPGGTIAYPMPTLTPGPHSLKLKVWDTSGNSASEEIDFVAVEDMAPTIYDIYTDANPARTHANFYISHDRPDAQVTVTVGIYSLLGRPIWEATATGRSDMFTSVPVTWNLTDSSGSRVPRGIYLYRATIKEADGQAYETASRKLAVAAQ